MEKYLDHEIHEIYWYCKNCSYSRAQIVVYKYTCAEILKKSRSHKWNNDKLACEVCGIYPFTGNLVNGIIIAPENFYTCNEYLMIKANE